MRLLRSTNDGRWLALVVATLVLVTQEGWAVRAPAPSVLFNYTSGTIAMTDLRVEISATGTYWCALEWDAGYMGLQRGGSGYVKHVQFSVWDPPSGGPTTVTYLNPNGRAAQFTGEGSGAVTYYPFDWQEGALYSFAIEVVQNGSGGADYLGYFIIHGPVPAVIHLATIRRPGARASLGYVGGFLEDFGETPTVRRSGLYGNCWVKEGNAIWRNCQEVYFDASIPVGGPDNFNGRVVGAMFRLETGGATVNDLPIRTTKVLDPSPGIQQVAPASMPDSFFTVPFLLTQPPNQTVLAGQDMTMSVQALGTAPLFFQWYREGIALPGQNSSTLRLQRVLPEQAGRYQLSLSNAYTSGFGINVVWSQSSQLTVLSLDGAVIQHDATGNLTNIQTRLAVKPSLANDLVPMQAGLGEPLSLTVPVQDAGFATYQWFRDGVVIPGATSPVLHLATTSLADAGRYSLAVSNTYGVSDSNNCQSLSCYRAGGVSVDFHPAYGTFNPGDGLFLTGGAALTNGVLRLTRPVGAQAGSAWFANPLSGRNGFTSRFSFRITDAGNGGGDGLWFCLQGNGTNLVSDGYGPWAVIKFATWQNSGEISANFVGVQGPGFGPTAVDLTPFNIRLDDGSTHGAEISHDGLSVNVWLDGQQVITNAPMPLDWIPSASGETWAGFGAHTGGAWEEHDILNWQFTPHRQYYMPDTTEPRARILINPVSQAVRQGDTAWLTARYLPKSLQSFSPPGVVDRQVLLDYPFDYQWWFNGVMLTGETNATLILADVQPGQAGEYSVALFGRIYGGIIGGARSVEIGAATNTLAVVMPIMNLFNTGLDDNHKAIAYGATDPHWRLLPGSPNTDPPVAAYTGDGWMYSNTNSAWLTPSTLISPGGVSTYRYQTWFWLQPWEAASAIIRGQWAAALQGTDILINGFSTGQATATVPFQLFAPFMIKRGFVAGSNSLTFVVYNGGSADTGLRVEFAGGTELTNAYFLGDSEGDGLLDAIEMATFGNLWQIGSDDFDGDGVSNADELAEGTDPANPASLRPRLTVSAFSGQVLRDPILPSYERGSVVTLTAIPNAGGVFPGWSGDLHGTQNQVSFPITSNMSVQANFTLPYNWSGWPVPGLVEAENFDEGGEGVAYHESDLGNNGAPFGPILRTTDVDLFPALAASGGYRVGWTATGEWLKYTLNVASNGIYRVELGYTSGGNGGTVHFEFVGGSVSFPFLAALGSYDTYRSVTSALVRLDQGLQVARLVVDNSYGFDLDYFRVVATTSAPPFVAMSSPIPGQTFAAGMNVPLTATASDPDGSVAKVEYVADGIAVAEATNAPYAVSWRPPTAGLFTLAARATDNVGLMATSAPVTITFASGLLLGSLKAEYFTNIAGGAISDLTNHARFLANTPDIVEQTTQFESRTNWADNYGARLSGWLVPPTSGNYKFYLASDDQGVLFLSTDELPAHKVQIAAEPQWNGYREFMNGQNQVSRGTPATNISGNIALVAGKPYFVEALLKEAVAGDCLSVAWLPPGGSAVTNGAAPIPGKYLALGVPYAGPFQPLSAASLTNSGQIGVSFGRLLDLATATATANYQVPGTTVTGAALSPDRQGVLLSVSGLSGSSFTVRVGAVKDLFGNSTPASTELMGPVLPQTRQDVGTAGDPVAPGITFSSRAGDFDVVASGSDIWNSADHFHFVYEQRTGDFDVQVRVESFEAINRWSKAGLMARETLTAGSQHVLALVAPAGPTWDGDGGGQGLNAYELLIRSVASQPAASWATNNGVANVPFPNAWIRLKREGNNFNAYRSSDGLSWTQLGQTNQTYPATVYVGLATTSHNNSSGYTALARYRNYGSLSLPPWITGQPRTIGATVGGTASLQVTVDGTPPLAYQWRRDGIPLPGATAGSYVVSPVQLSDARSYDVVVSNAWGSLTSAPARLIVASIPLTGLFNTGVNAAGAALADGGSDPHYGLAVNADSPSTNAIVENSTAFPIVSGPWLANSPTSKWIGPRFDTTAAAGQAQGNGLYVYRTTFGLTGLDRNSVVITGDWAVDDAGVSLRVNGTPSGLVNNAGFGTPTSFTLNAFNAAFVDGVNTLEFEILNNDAIAGYTGLRVGNLRGFAASRTLPPVSSGFGVTMPQNQPLTLTVAALLGPITDPEGGLVTLASVSATSTNGGTVVLNGVTVTYTPVLGFVGADRFSYVVSDPLGAQSTVSAQIAVLPPELVVNTIQPPVVTRQGVSFGFVGLPGNTYQVLRAVTPLGPWLDAGTVWMRSDGTGQYSDTAPPPSQAFYRVRLLR